MIKKNTILKKQRVQNYFIDAAIEIAREGGMEAITLRSIADKAGYNSATIYNYFDNLDELIGYACIRILKKYLITLNQILADDSKDFLQKYLLIWEQYCINSFGDDAAMYMQIYYSNDGNVLQYLEKYFDDFPEDLLHMGEEFKEINSLEKPFIQDDYMLAKCVRDGFIDEKDIKDIIRFSTWLHLGMLSSLLLKKEQYHVLPEEMADIFMGYFTEYLTPRLKVKMTLRNYA